VAEEEDVCDDEGVIASAVNEWCGGGGVTGREYRNRERTPCFSSSDRHRLDAWHNGSSRQPRIFSDLHRGLKLTLSRPAICRFQ
jgi:hypothetical protein